MCGVCFFCLILDKHALKFPVLGPFGNLNALQKI